MATPSEQQVCVAKTKGFFERLGQPIPNVAELPGFISDLLRSCLKADRIECGRIIFSFVVNHAFTNHYNTLHGGAVGCLADAVTMACAKFVAGDVELFVGETSTSYLSASRLNAATRIPLHMHLSIWYRILPGRTTLIQLRPARGTAICVEFLRSGEGGPPTPSSCTNLSNLTTVTQYSFGSLGHRNYL